MKPASNRIRRALKVSFALLLLSVTAALAQSPGTFTTTGGMSMPRSSHTATLLPNGRVLIAGGSPGFGSTVGTNGADLYDPASGQFTTTRGMTTTRAWHTATLLPDGRVLIVGDSNAELYDPLTGIFTGTGAMVRGKPCHSATLLGSGIVLIAGGGSTFRNPPSDIFRAELYDPATGNFAATGAYATEFPNDGFSFCPIATLLTDGRVLIAWAGSLPFVDIYDPGTGKFIQAGPHPLAWLHQFTATLLMNGQVLLAGGENEDFGPSNKAAVYDPSTRTFISIAEMTTPRDRHTATLLPDGKVLIAGSEWNRNARTFGDASTELYDPTTGRFAFGGNMTRPRDSYTATLLPDGNVLMTGGFSPYPDLTSSAELYRSLSPAVAAMLFSVSGNGMGQGAILHPASPQFASASNPAVIGEALEIYCTGLVEGSVIPPQVGIGGRVAEILFFGQAPGWPGLNQVNIRVPAGVAPGPAVTVRMTYLNRPSNEVTIGVR